MGLVKVLVALVVIHLGMGFAQVAVNYFASDIADYGAAGWISHTPIGELVPLDNARELGDAAPKPGQLEQVLSPAIRVGEMINGLASFGYGFLEAITPDDGFVYTLVMGFRVFSVLILIGVALRLLYVLFDSGILNSTFGMAAVGLGVAGTVGASALGAVF